MASAIFSSDGAGQLLGRAPSRAADVLLANVSNQRAEGKVRGDIAGIFMGSGDAAVHATLSPGVKRPELDVTVRVDGTEMPAKNDLLHACAGVDAVSGRFSPYSEVSVRQGSINGYAKPLFTDRQLHDATQDREKTFIHNLKERFMDAAAWILEHRARGEVATRVDLSGSLDSPQFSTWEALGGCHGADVGAQSSRTTPATPLTNAARLHIVSVTLAVRVRLVA